MIDILIGPSTNKWSNDCTFNSGHPDDVFDPTLNCGKKATHHIMTTEFNRDGFFIGLKSCNEHYPELDRKLIKQEHMIESLCALEAARWNEELNECTIPLSDFELALLGTTELGKDITYEAIRT